eukprot:4891195-Pyramimonas_sp.AAC.1
MLWSRGSCITPCQRMRRESGALYAAAIVALKQGSHRAAQGDAGAWPTGPHLGQPQNGLIAQCLPAAR